MSSRMAIRGAIGIAVSILAIVLLLGTVDLSGAVDHLAALQPGWLLLAPFALAAQLALRSRRWAFLLSTAASAPVRTIRVVGPLAVGYLANALLPARLGEVARSILVARRERLRIGLVVGSVAVERVLDLVALVALGTAVAGVAVVGWGSIAVAAVLIGGLGAVIVAAPATARWAERVAPAALQALIGGFLAAMGAVGLRSSIVVVALSAVAWLGDVVVMWAAARALGIELTVPAAVAIAVGAAIGTAVPAASGYIGTYEAGAVAVGALAGTPADAVLAIAVIAHVLSVVPLALLGAGALVAVGGRLQLSRTRDEPAGHTPAPA